MPLPGGRSTPRRPRRPDEEASRQNDLAAYRRFNRAFHFVAFERSGRPWLVRFLRILWDAAARYQSPLFTGGAWQIAHPSHHRALLDGLLCRNVDEVNREMDEHRRWLLDRVARSAAPDTHRHT
jgi:DNA-binding GntR family transcriptional regulator